MAKVGIVMGSDSDMPVMAKAADVLEKLGVDYEMTIISAHREPDVFFSDFIIVLGIQNLHPFVGRYQKIWSDLYHIYNKSCVDQNIDMCQV